MFNENEGFHFQSFDGCSTRNLVEITSKPTKTGAGYYTTKQTEMHLLMLGTKLVLFWADTSEKLEKLKESSEGDLAAVPRSGSSGQSNAEFFQRFKNCAGSKGGHFRNINM